MRRLLAARGASVAAVGLCALLAVGGGYALASSSGGKTIAVCVSHHGGALYKAKTCAKHDKKLSWNKVGPKGAKGSQGQQGIQGIPGNTGPQGPGATSLVYNASGSASPTRATIGTLGPWTVTGLCTQSGSSTGMEIDITGPGYSGDVMGVLEGTAAAGTGTVPGPVTDLNFGSHTPVSTQSVSSVDGFLVPTSGSPLHVFFTIVANGATPPAGAANTCHMSVVATPVAAPPTSTAAPAKQSGAQKAPTGATLLGLPLAR